MKAESEGRPQNLIPHWADSSSGRVLGGFLVILAISGDSL
jgi:hypothetical protein